MKTVYYPIIPTGMRSNIKGWRQPRHQCESLHWSIIYLWCGGNVQCLHPCLHQWNKFLLAKVWWKLWIMDAVALNELSRASFRKFRANWEAIIEKVLCRVWMRRFQAFSFLCTFVPGSEKSTERTFAPVELSFRGTFAPWNFCSCRTFVPRERMFQELSLHGTFAPVLLSFLGSERSKNFRSYETVVPWERIFQELTLQMS